MCVCVCLNTQSLAGLGVSWRHAPQLIPALPGGDVVEWQLVAQPAASSEDHVGVMVTPPGR